MKCFGYDHLKIIATTNRNSACGVPQTTSNLTIVDQEMDGAVIKWLYYLKLHKYQWFFNSLSFFTIVLIDEYNIEKFIHKININSIKKDAQKKICKSTKLLRNRSQKLKDILIVNFTLTR